jgi:hypothetical protein
MAEVRSEPSSATSWQQSGSMAPAVEPHLAPSVVARQPAPRRDVEAAAHRCSWLRSLSCGGFGACRIRHEVSWLQTTWPEGRSFCAGSTPPSVAL